MRQMFLSSSFSFSLSLFHTPFFSQMMSIQNSARTREICVNDFECESDNENRGSGRQHHLHTPLQQQQAPKHKTADQSVTTSIIVSRAGSPILPDQDLLKKIEKLEQEESRNGHYELVCIGKAPSEPNLKLNTTKKTTSKDCKQCRDESNDLRHPPQTTSLTNINANNNETTTAATTTTSHANGNQSSSNNFYFLRSRTQTKSLSTRISSLKRESKTTRTLSIVMFVFIGRTSLFCSGKYKKSNFLSIFRLLAAIFRSVFAGMPKSQKERMNFLQFNLFPLSLSLFFHGRFCVFRFHFIPI